MAGFTTCPEKRQMVTKVMGQERITTIDNVEQNINLPADSFALPADIKALIKKN